MFGDILDPMNKPIEVWGDFSGSFADEAWYIEFMSRHGGFFTLLGPNTSFFRNIEATDIAFDQSRTIAPAESIGMGPI
ncbi:hypothetical protein ACX1C1_12915 [Paenibacillus sp. strain BS8-2]